MAKSLCSNPVLIEDEKFFKIIAWLYFLEAILHFVNLHSLGMTFVIFSQNLAPFSVRYVPDLVAVSYTHLTLPTIA